MYTTKPFNPLKLPNLPQPARVGLGWVGLLLWKGWVGLRFFQTAMIGLGCKNVWNLPTQPVYTPTLVDRYKLSCFLAFMYLCIMHICILQIIFMHTYIRSKDSKRMATRVLLSFFLGFLLNLTLGLKCKHLNYELNIITDICDHRVQRYIS